MKIVFIGVCGGSASGKTTLCSELYSLYKEEAQIISQDAYYHDRSGLSAMELKGVNFDHPESVDLDMLYSDLLCLKSGNNVSIPRYCFKTHARLPDKTEIEKRKIIFVEGLFIYETEKLRNLFDLKIYVTADDDIRLIRRIKRDIEERGRELNPLLEQYLNNVKPMHDIHIESKNKYADYVIDTSNNHKFDDINKALLSNINALVGD